MKTSCYTTLFILLALCLCACGIAAPPATTTPIPTDTQTGTSAATDLPSSMPTGTLTPTETPVPPTEPVTGQPTDVSGSGELPMPKGTPMAVWNGVTIMPGAVGGLDKDSGYFFTIKSTPKAIQAYYQKVLGALGWNLLAVGQGNGKATLLIFEKGGNTFSVSIINPQNGSGLLQVVLVQ